MSPKMSIMKTLTKETYKFPCERWLDANEDDNEVVRELPGTGDLIPEPLTRTYHALLLSLTYKMISLSNGYFCFSSYQVPHHSVHRERERRRTDAHVFLCLVGDQGDTGERALINCKNNVNKFEKGNVSGVSVELLDVLVFVHLSLWRSALQTQNVPLTLVFGSRLVIFWEPNNNVPRTLQGGYF